MPEFREWPKIPRGGLETITITEKIDGTNACVIVENGIVTGAQSRSRIITPNDDNYGFAAWVEQHKDTLTELGDGYHYGEWAGPGIQKNRHQLDEKTFYLFNVGRYADERPAGCYLVPVLYIGEYAGMTNEVGQDIIDQTMILLRNSRPYNPEGVVVYYHKTRRYEKYTFEHPQGKWVAQNDS